MRLPPGMARNEAPNAARGAASGRGGKACQYTCGFEKRLQSEMRLNENRQVYDLKKEMSRSAASKIRDRQGRGSQGGQECGIRDE
jgi:hypothetical protein